MSLEPSTHELIVRRILDSLGVTYETGIKVGPYHPDIILRRPEGNTHIGTFNKPGIILEIDGYWHKIPAGITRDKKRDAYLLVQGYRTLRIPVRAIKLNSQQAVKDILCQM